MSGTIASGALELAIALQTPVPRGHLGVPALLWGKPGVGKTSLVESFARDDFPVVSVIVSIHDPTDIGGHPICQGDSVRFLPPEWALAFDAPKQGILLLDELTTAPPAVQAAALRVVLERRVGAKLLPAQVRVVAAANPPDTILGGWELSPPLANRFLHLNWELSGATLASALRDGFEQPKLPHIDVQLHREAVPYWRMLTAAFLSRDPTLVYTTPAEGEYAFASPRTWYDFAVPLMASCDVLDLAPHPGCRGNPLFHNLMQGSVGSGAAISFAGFLKGLHLPDPELVLDGKEQVDVGALQDDELHVLFCSLASGLLRRCSRDSNGFVAPTLVTLSLVERVNEAGKLDTVFAPVRQLARGKALQRAAVDAHREGSLREFQLAVERVFSKTPLTEYIRVLDGTHGTLSESPE